MRWNIFLVICTLFLISCHSKKSMIKETQQTSMDREIVFAAGPQAIIYKTTGDYSDFVPVLMNAQKTKIVSYPAPSDVYYLGKLAKPTLLKNGYLLDNRGINEHVAFLNYTYEEYSKLPEAPSMEQMMKNIRSLHPLTEFVNCGLRTQYKNEVEELNNLIDNNFKNCRRLKMPVMNVR